jgi:hypothetical protein
MAAKRVEWSGTLLSGPKIEDEVSESNCMKDKKPRSISEQVSQGQHSFLAAESSNPYGRKWHLFAMEFHKKRRKKMGV